MPVEPSPFAAEWVSALPLFRDLLPREIERVRDLLTPLCVAPETQVVVPAHNGEALYLLHSGVIKVTAVSEPHEMIVEIRGPGSLTGALSILDGGDLLHVTAQMPCEMAVLSRFDFWNSVWPMPAVPFNLAHILAERLHERNVRMLEMGTLDVPSRLARTLAKPGAPLRTTQRRGRHRSLVSPHPGRTRADGRHLARPRQPNFGPLESGPTRLLPARQNHRASAAGTLSNGGQRIEPLRRRIAAAQNRCGAEPLRRRTAAAQNCCGAELLRRRTAAAQNCCGAELLRPHCPTCRAAFTRQLLASHSTVIAPSRSVRNVAAPASLRRRRTGAAGVFSRL